LSETVLGLFRHGQTDWNIDLRLQGTADIPMNATDIPGAESTKLIIDRSQRLLDFVEQNFPGKKVLAVSHGALIRFVLHVVTAGEVPPKGERLDNASLHVVRKQQQWALDAWSPRPLGS